jgi:hypothetical protein
MKHEWRKKEREYYLPGNKPVRVQIPEFGFFSIKGKGNPNDEFFAEYIAVLYSLSYAVKMSPKKGIAPEGYFDYTVYPLEGIWDINEETKNNFTGTIDKNDLVFNLMIRQPDFVDKDYAAKIVEQVQKTKPHHLLAQVKFEKIRDGDCVQMMHHGSYDNEPESFRIMENFAEEMNLRRLSKIHREIYLTDARKVDPSKLKTVLRFEVNDLKAWRKGPGQSHPE